MGLQSWARNGFQGGACLVWVNNCAATAGLELRSRARRNFTYGLRDRQAWGRRPHNQRRWVVQSADQQRVAKVHPPA